MASWPFASASSIFREPSAVCAFNWHKDVQGSCWMRTTLQLVFRPCSTKGAKLISLSSSERKSPQKWSPPRSSFTFRSSYASLFICGQSFFLLLYVMQRDKGSSLLMEEEERPVAMHVKRSKDLGGAFHVSLASQFDGSSMITLLIWQERKLWKNYPNW